MRAELDAWRDWLLAGQTGRAPREPLGSLLAGVIDKHRIPVHYLTDLVDGLASDLIPREFTSFSQLHHYCYQVASTVGLAMAHVLDATRPEALAAAADLGVAMQLTATSAPTSAAAASTCRSMNSSRPAHRLRRSRGSSPMGVAPTSRCAR